MRREDIDALWAQQQELEDRRCRDDELLENDPGYLNWLDLFDTQQQLELNHYEHRRLGPEQKQLS